MEKHKHNGLDNDRINSCDIEVNIEGKNFKSDRLEKVIKEIDESIEEKLKVNGENNNLLVINNGLIVDSGINKKDLVDKKHKHNEYIAKKLGEVKNKVIVSDGNEGIKVSDIDLKDIVVKDEINNKVDKKEIKEDNIIVGGDGGLKDSGINIKDIEIKNHKHNEYLRKFEAKENNILVMNKNNIVDSGINIDDIFLKNDKKKYSGKEGDIFILKDGEIVNSGVNINDVELKGHKHSVKDINGLKEFDEGKIKEIVKEVVKEIFNKIKELI